MYSLIWKNTIQSCMADALYQIILSKITAPFEKEYKCLRHILSCSNEVNVSREKRQNTSQKNHCVKGRPGKGGPKLARAL